MIPKWVSALLKGEDVFINGDGQTSRDFCYIENCVQANLLAATARNEEALNQVYNVAYGERTTLNALYEMILQLLSSNCQLPTPNLIYRDFRAGDVRHSLANITKAQTLLGYEPSHHIKQGLGEAMDWYVADLT